MPSTNQMANKSTAVVLKRSLWRCIYPRSQAREPWGSDVIDLNCITDDWSATNHRRFCNMPTMILYTVYASNQLLHPPWGNVNLTLCVWCLLSLWICEMCSHVCIKKKKKKKGGGAKCLGSVSVTENLLNHLPSSNKIEHQAELNRCQTPRHHPNREEISSTKGRGCLSRDGR